MYYEEGKLFNSFLIHLDRMPDNWDDRIILFVAHLIEPEQNGDTAEKQKTTAPQMIASYASGIKAELVLKLLFVALLNVLSIFA